MQLTIRQVPGEIAAKLKRQAGAWGLSLNKAVLRILEGQFQAPGASAGAHPKRRDLSEFHGAAAGRDAEDLERSTRAQRRVDPDLWK